MPADGMMGAGPSPGLPGQPGFGPMNATAPTPNRGNQAAAMAKLAWVVRVLSDLIPQLGVDNEPGRDVLNAVRSLSKHVPPGSMGGAGVENSALQQMQMQSRQEAPMLALLRATQGAGAGGVPGAAPGITA